MKNKKFFIILSLEIVAVLCIALYLLVDHTTISSYFKNDIKFYEQPENCDLHVNSCSATLPSYGKISFDIKPKSIPLMKPLIFELTTQDNILKETLDLHIFATNMNMGYYDLKMKKVSQNLYTATTTLPTCIVGNMIWRAEVVLGDEAGVFIFKTK
ncbi:hypothetical protein [Sulfurospirillum arcachonense]|uniref:hypothetical protein n=1 Tax=Sulfurospirillum arcachonense TaxID=57666 RepID=UPI0004683AF8|nr:hypothetical protein [Sulfurospirillum arcachonense]